MPDEPSFKVPDTGGLSSDDFAAVHIMQGRLRPLQARGHSTVGGGGRAARQLASQAMLRLGRPVLDQPLRRQEPMSAHRACERSAHSQL